MIKKIVNKINYILKINFRKIFYYLRFFKNKKKGLWNVKNFDNYQEYINFQKEKTLDQNRRLKWLNDEWDEKVKYFDNILNIKEGLKLTKLLSRLPVIALMWSSN